MRNTSNTSASASASSVRSPEGYSLYKQLYPSTYPPVTWVDRLIDALISILLVGVLSAGVWLMPIVELLRSWL